MEHFRAPSNWPTVAAWRRRKAVPRVGETALRLTVALVLTVLALGTQTAGVAFTVDNCAAVPPPAPGPNDGGGSGSGSGGPIVKRIFLSPSQTNVGVGSIFTVDIQVGASGDLVDSVDTFLNFNPAKLQVVDAGGNPATAITPSATSPLLNALHNSVDNGAGRIQFSAGRLPSGTPATGVFTLATVRFKALAPSVGSGVTLSTTTPRKSDAFFNGPALGFSVQGSTIGIRGVTLGLQPSKTMPAVGEVFTVNITAEAGSQTDAIDVFLNFDATKFKIVDESGNPVGCINPRTDSLLTNTPTNVVDNATGRIQFSAGRGVNPAATGFFTLATIRFKAVAPAKRTDISFSRAGTRVTNAFFQLQSVLGPFSTPVAPTPGTDLDLSTSPVVGARLGVAGVLLSLDPPTKSVGSGEIFTLALKANTGPHQVDGIDVYLDFNPAVLQVVNASGNPATTIEVNSGSPLKLTLLNMVSNSAGQLDFSVGRQTSDPVASGTFTLATMRFKMLATSPVTSTIMFSETGLRSTDAALDGISVIGPTDAGSSTVSVVGKTLAFDPAPGKAAHSFSVGVKPVVKVRQGESTVTSDNTTVVTLRIKPDTGTPGATLTCAGGTSHAVTAGVITFNDCKIDLTGTGYVLEAQASGMDTEESASFPVIWGGDVTGDCLVDIVDFSVLMTSFGKAQGTTGYNADADVNGDNQVDIVDFSTLETLFGTQCPTLSLGPQAGSAGATVTATGSAYAGNKMVSLTFDGTPLTTPAIVSTGSGNFTAAFTVPVGTPAGIHIVKASQLDGRVIAAAVFTVP